MESYKDFTVKNTLHEERDNRDFSETDSHAGTGLSQALRDTRNSLAIFIYSETPLR